MPIRSESNIIKKIFVGESQGFIKKAYFQKNNEYSSSDFYVYFKIQIMSNEPELYKFYNMFYSFTGGSLYYLTPASSISFESIEQFAAALQFHLNVVAQGSYPFTINNLSLVANLDNHTYNTADKYKRMRLNNFLTNTDFVFNQVEQKKIIASNQSWSINLSGNIQGIQSIYSGTITLDGHNYSFSVERSNPIAYREPSEYNEEAGRLSGIITFEDLTLIE